MQRAKMGAGNICRSPSAEAVFKAVVERAGLADRFFIDSCGTGGGASQWYKDGGFSYHEGNEAGVPPSRPAYNKRPCCICTVTPYDRLVAATH